MGGIEDAKGTGMLVLRCASTAASAASTASSVRAPRSFAVTSLAGLLLSSARHATKRAEPIAAIGTGSKNKAIALAEQQR